MPSPLFRIRLCGDRCVPKKWNRDIDFVTILVVSTTFFPKKRGSPVVFLFFPGLKATPPNNDPATPTAPFFHTRLPNSFSVSLPGAAEYDPENSAELAR